ncbi:MAG: hypothetical protein CBB93_001515 [Oceanospirillales bacterium TMED33]|nr:MAG: hypothetical protein CBB93_001515 [Oceanospirillales bacterium TMED33]
MFYWKLFERISMRLVCLRNCFALIAIVVTTGCGFEPVKYGYSKSQVSSTSSDAVIPHGSEHSLLVFRTSGFKLWEKQDAEFLINGESIAFFKAGGAGYFPLTAGRNTIVVREPEHFLKCELEFDFEPGSGQFVEIYERFDPGSLMLSFVLADLQSRMLYDPHPGTKCSGVYGLSMGQLEQEQLADVHREFSFQVVQR